MNPCVALLVGLAVTLSSATTAIAAQVTFQVNMSVQTATDLSGSSWQDVPNTLGQGEASVPVGSGTAFFQLVGP